MAESAQNPQEPKTGAPRVGIEGIIDSVADLLQTAVDWLRQEAATVVREKIVLPIQRLGLTLVSALAAAVLLVTGLIFVAVAVFLYLAQWLGYPGALLLIGGVYVVAAAVFLVIKVRLMQK